MFLTRSEYDRGVNTFSPEGRLFQVEYAIEASKVLKLTSTVSVLQKRIYEEIRRRRRRRKKKKKWLLTREGVILAVEKVVTSPLLETKSIEKIVMIDDCIGCAMSGLTADARTLMEHGRVETQNHRFSYNEAMSVESTTQALCNLALKFGEGDESMSRPFGASLLIAGHDDHGPALFHTDPSGSYWETSAKAIGSGSEGADQALIDQYDRNMSLVEAETLALSILKQVMEETLTSSNVDVARVAPEFHIYSAEEVEAVIGRL